MDNKITLRRAGLLLAYPLAYLYLLLIWRFNEPSAAWICPTIFSVLFIAWNEIVLHGRRDKTDRRSFFWYAVMVLTSLTASITPSFGLSMLGIHLCAVYSVLISNNILVEGKTGSYIWLDLIRGTFVDPTLHLDSLIGDYRELHKKREGEEKKKVSLSWMLPVGILFPFFIVAMVLLSKINSDFDAIIGKVIDTLNILRYLGPAAVAKIILRLFFACPVCLFLYALAASSAKGDGEDERIAGEKCKAMVAGRRNVSSIATACITGGFASMYLLFFAVEFKYIFSGLMGILPDGFNVVDYARRGFFELVGIMAINMFVYLIVNIFERRCEGKGNVSKILMVVLMSESILFAIVSLSKLLMYFNTFGYTPKRMLAMWGTVILAAAAVTVIISHLKGKNHVRAWILFTAASYVLMSIISGVFLFTGFAGNAGLNQRGAYAVTIWNQSDRNIYAVSIDADGEMLGSISNADGSPLIAASDSEELLIRAEDLPWGSNLREAELEFTFYDTPECDHECNNYWLTRERGEYEISTTIVLAEYRTYEQ